MSNKSKLGQFYTTNYDYILQNMCIPDTLNNIIEPFAGNGDLLNFITDKDSLRIECYDIDPKKDFIIERDTLNDPPCYDDKFVITNPPYLARNKNKDKSLYEKYKCNDLYKCFILNLVDSDCDGGIIIIPLNFICSIRKTDIELRRRFLERYNILKLNIFEERVFEDTAYAVCSLQFEKKTVKDIILISCQIYPSNKTFQISLELGNNYTIGGEIYNLSKSKIFCIERATRLTKDEDCITNILLKCIDDSLQNKIKLKMVEDDGRFFDNTPNLSARSYATLVIKPRIDMYRQEALVNAFNTYIETHREKYNSLFLTNYRESNSIARKRISFDLAFLLCSHLLDHVWFLKKKKKKNRFNHHPFFF